PSLAELIGARGRIESVRGGVRHGSMATRSTRWSERFEPDAPSVAAARRMVDHLPAPCREAARGVGSELASHAVRHAGTPHEVVVDLGERVRIGVRDANHEHPCLQVGSLDDVSGRGLLLVASLSASWGFEWRDGGKVVWAELPVDDAAVLADAC